MTTDQGEIDRLRAELRDRSHDLNRAAKDAVSAEEALSRIRKYADGELYHGPVKVDACTVREQLLRLLQPPREASDG